MGISGILLIVCVLLVAVSIISMIIGSVLVAITVSKIEYARATGQSDEEFVNKNRRNMNWIYVGFSLFLVACFIATMLG